MRRVVSTLHCRLFRAKAHRIDLVFRYAEAGQGTADSFSPLLPNGEAILSADTYFGMTFQYDPTCRFNK